jgi:hypothetical protein
MFYKTICAVLVSGLAIAIRADAAPPQPPCFAGATPSYPPPGAAPAVAIWHQADLKQSEWRPPSCTGWSASSGSKLVVAVAGSFHFNGPIAPLLDRVGAISAFRNIRYWSITDKAWRPLANDASALSSADKANRRPDFSATELIKDANLYYWEDDNRSGEIVYRLNVIESTSDRAVIGSENVTPIRKYFLTLFPSGALQSVVFVQRLSPGLYGIYILSRTGDGTSVFADGHDGSYVNRAVALYRQVAGIKPDQDPPAVR